MERIKEVIRYKSVDYTKINNLSCVWLNMPMKYLVALVINPVNKTVTYRSSLMRTIRSRYAMLCHLFRSLLLVTGFRR